MRSSGIESGSALVRVLDQERIGLTGPCTDKHYFTLAKSKAVRRGKLTVGIPGRSEPRARSV